MEERESCGFVFGISRLPWGLAVRRALKWISKGEKEGVGWELCCDPLQKREEGVWKRQRKRKGERE